MKLIFYYILILNINAVANDDEDIKYFLNRFHQSSFVMRFEKTQQEPHQFLRNSKIYSLPLDDDLPTPMRGSQPIQMNLEKLDLLKLTSSSLTKIPWSDSYWPMYKGYIGIRYADPEFPDSNYFEDNYNYVLDHSALAIVATEDEKLINQLSAAEKYDLLLGDDQWTLTKYVWQLGQNYLQKNGEIPHWIGICHGWAGAAHMNISVSHQPIEVESVHHIKITFYPSDLKALQSMLWANASPPTRFIGHRCILPQPPINQFGRILDSNCLDNNPSTFHLVLTHQIGVNQRSFVMDATYHSEVWNFPITGYQYKYFNPETLEPTLDFKQALVLIENFKIDKFKEFRSSKVQFVVGIIMDDTIVVEMNPSRLPQETSSLKTLRHYYDLELDSELNIIGGEWYSLEHPDFMWTYEENAKAQSTFDLQMNTNDWVKGYSVPEFWTSFAKKASSQGQPLLSVINSILARE